MTRQQLDNLEKLAEKATKGVWHVMETLAGFHEVALEETGEDYANWPTLLRGVRKQDAELIVALVNAFPDLLALARKGLAAEELVKAVEKGKPTLKRGTVGDFWAAIGLSNIALNKALEAYNKMTE